VAAWWETVTRRVAVVLLVIVAFALAVADVVIMALPRTIPLPDVYGFRGSGAVTAVAFTIVGAAIALRQPRNAVGWIFLVSGTFAPFLDGAYAQYALAERRGALPGGEWAAWLLELALCISISPIATYLLLVFPNGRPPSPRWRPVAWYTLSALAMYTAAVAFVFPLVGHNPELGNPASLGLPIDLDESGRRLLAVIFLGPAAILCGAAFVHRFRSSRGVPRQQLKWMAYAATIVVVANVFLPVTFGRKPLEIANQFSFLGIAIAAAVAILRYRLYDIDVLINRTLVYGALTALLGVVYVVSVLLSQNLLRGLTAGSDIAVAGSTLLVVALFQPIRARVQEIVDRRFYRARYDAARTIDAFSVRLRGDVELDSVRADLIAVIHDTMHPAHASVWLRGGPR
jgi:hypothetical protein